VSDITKIHKGFLHCHRN